MTGLRGLALLDAAIAHIEAGAAWNQDDFRCGSGMCVGGWICELAGGKWLTSDPDGPLAWYLVPEAEDYDIEIVTTRIVDDRLTRAPAVAASARAERLLGAPARFTDLCSGERTLFDGGNDLEDIKRIRNEIAAWFESQAIS